VTTTTVAGAAAEDDEAAPLLAWADASPEEGKAPLTVEFKADVEGGTPPLKYVWKFNDDTPDSTEPNPKHVFQKAGRYRADLSVTASAGDEDADYIDIEVQ
jgi:PKD repeat protein